MTNIPDLWPKTFAPDEIRSPFEILRQQGEILFRRTNGILIGEPFMSNKSMHGSFTEENFGEKLVSIFNRNDETVFIHFYIVAALLKNYRYQAFEVRHDAFPIYPCRIITENHSVKTPNTLQDFAIVEDKIVCKDADEFVEQLKMVFSSEKITKAINSLIGQSNSYKGTPLDTVCVRLLNGVKINVGSNEQVVVWRRGAGDLPVTYPSSRVDDQDKRHPINLRNGAPVLVYHNGKWHGGHLEK